MKLTRSWPSTITILPQFLRSRELPPPSMPPGLVYSHKYFLVNYLVAEALVPLRWQGSARIPESCLTVLQDTTRSTAVAVRRTASGRPQPQYYNIVDPDQPNNSAHGSANRTANLTPTPDPNSSRTANPSPPPRTRLAPPPFGLGPGDIVRPLDRRQASPPRAEVAENALVSLQCRLQL